MICVPRTDYAGILAHSSHAALSVPISRSKFSASGTCRHNVVQLSSSARPMFVSSMSIRV